VGIIILGAFAALTQIGVANTVITPVLWALLAAIVGVLVVGIGGGLIKPMQTRWERMLNRAESETSAASDRVRANRASRASAPGAAAERNVNAPGGFGQPGYGGAMPTDQKQPETPDRGQGPADAEDETEKRSREREEQAAAEIQSRERRAGAGESSGGESRSDQQR
jgi:hypothetical protein